MMYFPVEVWPNLHGRPVLRLKAVGSASSSNTSSTSSGVNPFWAMCSTFPPGSSSQTTETSIRATPPARRIVSRLDLQVKSAHTESSRLRQALLQVAHAVRDVVDPLLLVADLALD